ncbi:conserved hypothetical protein [Tenacibaculum sp. 190524A02b]|uniref:Uncharacterized protein n=1 Tax=Tenacibaculum vairaonense TaxID=3137860 RepID=A0ABP1F4U0_9FLAO
MIVFYGSDFSLNLTETKISFVEENPLFYNYFVRNYTWPFTKTLDAETSKVLKFLNLENSTKYKTKFYGKLQIDNTFDQAYLIFTDHVGDSIEGTIYYGKATFPLLDKKLSKLPFPVISTESITSHAKEVIEKQYPEVGHNFPMVIDEKFKETNKYDKFLGVINNYRGSFLENYKKNEDGKIIAYNQNIMVPFPYLMEILRVGFASENMIMAGSFVSDKVNEKLLIYTDKYLEKFDSGLPDDFHFSTTNEVWKDDVVTANFADVYRLSETGSYKVKLFLNIPSSIDVLDFIVELNEKELYKSNAQSINKSLTINIENSEDIGVIRFKLNLRKFTTNPNEAIGDIRKFNKFDFSFSDGQLNVFPKTFSLSEIMPDITFGAFLNKIKNWLNLEITFENNVVNINYIETKFLESPFKNETPFETTEPKRTFNQNKIYKLSTGNDELFISHEGVISTSDGYRDEDIVKIPTGIRKLEVEALDSLFTVKKKESEDLGVFLYDGLKNDLPVAVDSVFERAYTLNEVYNRYWLKWINFRLNSILIKDKFPVHVLEEFNINTGRFKYNQKHIYKKIQKHRISETHWEVEIESETLT